MTQHVTIVNILCVDSLYYIILHMMMNSELFMGVMMHLISDTVWKSISNDAFRDIMSKIIKEITEQCEFGSLKV